jgi:hypothetical protein
VRPELALGQRRGLALLDGQRLTSQRLCRGPVIDALQANDRTAISSRPAHDRDEPPGDRHGRAQREQARARARHIEASIQAVRATDATSLQLRCSAIHPALSVHDRVRLRRAGSERQSTMSTST